MAAPLLLALLIAGLEVRVETLAEDRYRLTVVFATGSLELHARAQMRLMEEARRLCRGRAARSEGTLEANQVPGRRNRIALSEIYRCAEPSGN